MFRSRLLFIILFLCGLTIAAPPDSFAQDSPAKSETSDRNVCTAQDTFALAVHGGAVWGQYPHKRKVEMLETLLPTLGDRLGRGATAIEAVQTAVHAMEDSGAFNAGKGAIANQAAVIEMDASIMDGRSLAAGAVAGVSRIRNPIDAARMVMEQSGSVLLIDDGAESFALENGATEAPTDYFLYSLGNTSDVPLPDDLKIAPPDTELPMDNR